MSFRRMVLGALVMTSCLLVAVGFVGCYGPARNQVINDR